MKRLVAIVLILAGIAGSAFGLHVWDTEYRFYRHSGTMKLHYLLHEAAFNRLSAQLSEDPLIASVRYNPPGSPKIKMAKRRRPEGPSEQAEFDKLAENVEAQQSRYEPILADLKFSGAISFHRSDSDPRLTESFGPTADFKEVFVSSMLVHAESTDRFRDRCPTTPFDHPEGDCAEHLGGNWWMRYYWSNSHLEK